MTELAIPLTTSTPGALSLVEWAHEAAAANQLAKSLCKTAFAGQFKGDEFGATAAILRGAEIGLTPVTSLAAFDLIQGQPAPKAITLRALAQSKGHDIEITESTTERAVARYRRAGSADWRECDFTIDDAQRMGLTGKDNWKKQPRAMLEARVTSKAARLVAADVLLGIGYSAEELRDGDVPSATEQRKRVTVAEIKGDVPAVTRYPVSIDTTPDADVCPACGVTPRHDVCPVADAAEPGWHNHDDTANPL